VSDTLKQCVSLFHCTGFGDAVAQGKMKTEQQQHHYETSNKRIHDDRN
jgi:hypothetical protein